MKISQLHIYPIKSAAPVSLEQSQVSSLGLHLDREWALFDASNQVLTARQYPMLMSIQCSIQDGYCCIYYNQDMICRLPIDQHKAESGEEVNIFSYHAVGMHVDKTIDTWMSNMIGESCRLLRVSSQMPRRVLTRHGGQPSDAVGFADQAPILITSTASLDDLNHRLYHPISMGRFRPNITIKGAMPYEEDSWSHITIGALRLRIIQRCERCLMTTIDPTTMEKNLQNEPLKSLALFRKKRNEKVTFGVHAVPTNAGAIKVGDNISVRLR